MPRSLPLYDPAALSLRVETETLRLPVDPGCERCTLGAGARNPCLPADGSPGGLYLLGESPGREEDLRGRPFVGATGAYLRKVIAQWWQGPVIYDTAVRCFPPAVAKTKDSASARAIEACRPYLAQTVLEAAPRRVLLLGSWAMQSFLGRSLAPVSARRGYTFLSNGTPVFLLSSPAAGLRNRFLRTWFEEDLVWALRANPPPPPVGARALLVDSPQDAAQAVAQLRAAGTPVAFDVETMGQMYSPGFRIVSFAACVQGQGNAFVWTRAACLDPATRAPLVAWLADPQAPKIGQNVKFDVAACRDAWGVMTAGVVGDVRLWRKLLEPEASARLQDMAELVGMGGHKEEAHAALTAAERRVRERLAWERRQQVKAQRAAAAPTPPPKRVTSRTKPPVVDPGPPPLVDLGVPPELEAQVRDPDIKSKAWSYGLLPARTLYRYNARDAVSTAALGELLHARLEQHPPFRRIWERVVREANTALAYVEHWGIAVDKRGLEVFDMQLELDERAAKATLDSFSPGTNWASPIQVAEFFYTKLGLTPPKLTDTDAPSTDKAALTILRPLHPAVEALMTYRQVTKLRGTYAAGMLRHLRGDGRIHPSILLDGATTGRTSCVAPWTLVRTLVGPKPILQVNVGDWVWTHKGRWRRVVAKFSQGVRPTFRVRLTTGDVLTCTGNHRLLSAAGHWVYVEEIYERFQTLGQRPRQPGGHPGHVPVQGVAHHGADSPARQHLSAQRVGRAEAVYAPGRAQGPGEAALLDLQEGHQQPHDGAGWGGAPQLERGPHRRPGLHDGGGQRETAVCAPRTAGSGVGPAGAAGAVRGAPHRQQPPEQRPGQPGAGDGQGAPFYPLASSQGVEVFGVEEVVRGTDCEVFDLTVADDQSYDTLGALSHNCKDPNLQNIPSEKRDPKGGPQYGRMSRDVFIAGKGKRLVQLDYSQLELRIAAMLSGDTKMTDTFLAGVDFHQRTAELVSRQAWKIPPEQVDKRHRAAAKTFNFGLLYGKTDGSLAEELNITRAEAGAIRAGILGEFKGLGRWLADRLAETRKTGEAWTYWDGERARRRLLYEVASQDDGKRINAENSAGNTPIQGTASDYCVASLAALVRDIVDEGLPAKLILAVHDSLMFEVEAGFASEMADRARAVMSGWPSGGVPLLVDCDQGERWGSLEPFGA